MRTLSIDLLPLRDIKGNGPRWDSQSSEPWFSVETRESLSGRWLQLVWRSGLLDHVCRPIIRFVTTDGVTDYFPGAAIFGANEWIGFAPENTVALHISPANTRGHFGFKVEYLALMSDLDLCQAVFSRSVKLGTIALAAWFVGKKTDSILIALDALALQPMYSYGRWRRQRLRDYDAAGIDGHIATDASRIHVRFLLDLKDRIGSEYRSALDDIAAQYASNWSVLAIVDNDVDRQAFAYAGCNITVLCKPDPQDLISGLDDNDLLLIVPPASRLSGLTVATLCTYAASNVNSDYFFVDTDSLAENGEHSAPKFMPGYDPILQHSLDYFGKSSFWRVGFLRNSQIDIRKYANTNRLACKSLVGTSIARVLISSRSGDETSNSVPEAEEIIRTAAKTTIIIPTRDRVDLLRPCINSILQKTDDEFELIVVDNDSIKPETLDFFSEIEKKPFVSIQKQPGFFNFSRLCNKAARSSVSELLIFLNNDTIVVNPDWISQLAKWALKPDIGAVGAKLLYPSGKIQHAGVVVGLGGQAGHFEQGISASAPGYFARAHMPHQLAAVTGACIAVERRKFEEVGGFDEVNLPIDLNDIDLCLRLGEKGYQTIYEPGCELIHHESATRGRLSDAASAYSQERTYFRARWLSIIRADPHFSPALSLYASSAMLG